MLSIFSSKLHILLKRNDKFNNLIKSQIGERLIRGGFWSLCGNILSKALLLLSTIILAHILGKNIYGQYSIIRTTIFMFSALASLGVGSLTTKYIAEYRDNNLQKAYNIYIIATYFSFIFGLLISVLIIIFSGWIASSQLNDPTLSNSIKCGALLLFFNTINGSQSGTLTGFEEFKIIAKNVFFSSLIEIIAIIFLGLFWDLNGALIGSAFGYLFLTIINNYHINDHFKCAVKNKFSNINKEDIKIIWTFGVPAALSNLTVIFALWITRTYLVRKSNFGEIAIYNVADQIKTFILFIPSALSTIILPILSNIRTVSPNNYNKVLKINILINILITFILSLIICLISKPLLSLWGKGFDHPLPLIILSISTIFTAFGTVVGQAIISNGKMWASFTFNMIWCFLVILFSYFFVGKGLGAVGLALGILISYIIHGLYQYLYLKFLLNHL